MSFCVSVIGWQLENYINVIAEGRSSNSIADALQLTEHRLEGLQAELMILTATHAQVFNTPPMEWLFDRIARVKEVLEMQTK